jgi:hypothetical protein
MALDGEPILRDVSGASVTTVAAPAGEHAVTANIGVAFPCHPGSRERAKIRHTVFVELGSGPAEVTFEVSAASRLDASPLRLRTVERGTIGPHDRLAEARRELETHGPIPEAELDCSRLRGEHRVECSIEARLREARWRHLDIEAAACLTRTLRRLRSLGPIPPEERARAFETAQLEAGQCYAGPGCYPFLAYTVTYPDCAAEAGELSPYLEPPEFPELGPIPPPL